MTTSDHSVAIPDRRRSGAAMMALAALGSAVALERLIDWQIDDDLAATMLALVVVMIVIVAVAPGTRPRRP